MSKRIFGLISLTLLILVFTTGFSQVNSLYSQFGFGDNSGRGFGQSKAMGNIGIGLRTNTHLNNINPASYNALDTMVVIYEMGLSAGFNNIESNLGAVKKSDVQIDYFAIGFLVNKHWATSFGMAPSSKVDYTLMSSTYDSIVGQIDTYFKGSGGLSKVYWGNSFRLTKRLSVGINTSFIFGPINKTTTVVFTDNYPYTDNTKMSVNQYIYNVMFNYGVQYTQPIGKDYSLTLGAVFENKTKLNATIDSLAGTTSNSGDYDESYYQEIHYGELKNVIIDTTGAKSTVDYPTSFGFGFTFAKNKQFMIGADFLMQNWSVLTNKNPNLAYNDLVSLNMGAELTPDRNSISSYMKRMSYRLGSHYTQSHLELKNTRINDYGLSFGLGLPLRNTNTSVNISGEFGRRGTLDQNLLRETYGILSINLSLSDIWFVKRKFK
ncbi:MAG: hypothetical protein WCX31_11730 [Salinivirgaceae bacterium]